jgi:hypothetical protein
MSHFNLVQLEASRPGSSRLLSLLNGILSLIPSNSIVLAQQFIDRYSKATPLLKASQLFLILHQYLDFHARLECMRVNKEWRNAIRQPNCWSTVFGTEIIIHHGKKLFCFPNSQQFVIQMSKCWSNIKDLSLWIITDKFCLMFLEFMRANPCIQLQSLTLEHHYDYLYDLQPVLQHFAPNLLQLHMSFDYWNGLNRRISSLSCPKLKELTAAIPFGRCFIDAPHLKRLNVKAII